MRNSMLMDGSPLPSTSPPQEVFRLYSMTSMEMLGVSTGWPCLDDLYKVIPGELTLVTGQSGGALKEWIHGLKDAWLAAMSRLCWQSPAPL